MCLFTFKVEQVQPKTTQVRGKGFPCSLILVPASIGSSLTSVLSRPSKQVSSWSPSERAHAEVYGSPVTSSTSSPITYLDSKGDTTSRDQPYRELIHSFIPSCGNVVRRSIWYSLLRVYDEHPWSIEMHALHEVSIYFRQTITAPNLRPPFLSMVLNVADCLTSQVHLS